ncbi:MAG: 4Fe-4S dicluster domain-containing protein [Chitinispirillales bacterium]|jgi:ferredoxin|nr:4Fe-4S dicluster domain-containing protein [Chitinispirillales bacterium]
MLKKLRFAAAAFFLIAVTLLFLDYTGTVHRYLGWTAKMQFFPAILAVNLAVVIGLILITLFLGRIYCSVICPLGLFQDKVSRIAGLLKKNRFSYRPPRKPLVVTRYAILAVFALAAVAGISVVPVLLEPYSAYGRMVSQLAGPLYKYANNILAGFAERAGSYAFYTVDIWIKSMPALVIAVLTLVVIGAFAWKSGRGYCNGVCPLGTFLGFLSKFSLVKLRIDKNQCVGCAICAKNCKAGCIDSTARVIDYTRCVACFNCIDRCPKKAVHYTKCSGVKTIGGADNSSIANKQLTIEGSARRGLITGTAMLAAGFITRALAVRTYDFDGGLASIEDKRAASRKTQIIPPGADNVRNFRRRCTGCQLCVSTCRNNVLRPSSELSSFMQPHMSFERGYCRPECVRCARICPTGAIRPITSAEKSSIQIGYAIWNRDLCVVNIDNVNCDLCERVCPTAAITRIPRDANDSESLKIPMIDVNRCTGCGACEHLCPSRPYSAIYVEGVEAHRTI